MMAARAGVPIVPMVIDGAFEAWPRTSLLPRPVRIRVACGRAIAPADLAGAEPDAVVADLAAEMAALQAELRRLPRGIV
jgi:1-acyl-sn-glycerol-3-phosphate acyltransferase